jgi:integrase
MPRKRTGTIERKHGRWYARITLSDGRRVRVPLPLGITEERARAHAQKIAEDIAAGLYEPPAPAGKGDTPTSVPAGATVAKWFETFCAHREARGYTSVPDDCSRFKVHIEPIIGDKPMARVTRAHIERIRNHLDAEIRLRARKPDEGLSWKTAWNVWGLVTTMFRDAVQSKAPGLRVRDDNPTVDVEGPDRGEELGNVHLYPSELATVADCEEVPLYRRRLYSVAAYTGAREQELRALLWSDVDLERGIIRISKSIDRKTRKVKSTKAKRARDVPIELGLRPLLQAMKDEAEGDRVLRVPPPEDCAALVRRDLAKAGVLRPALHGKDPGSHQITFHGLRDTYCTWRAVRGDKPTEIMTHAGHRSFATTQRYLDLAGTLRAGGGYGEPLAALPDQLLEPEPNRPRVSSPNGAKRSESLRPQRELNPCYQRERLVS